MPVAYIKAFASCCLLEFHANRWAGPTVNENCAQAALCGCPCRQTVPEQLTGPASEAADCLFLTVWERKLTI